MSELRQIRQVDQDEYVHCDRIEEIIGRAPYWTDEPPTEPPMTCVYCNAPWSPEMLELVELSGYCDTCANSERVIDVFCSACERLVYRKEV